MLFYMLFVLHDVIPSPVALTPCLAADVCCALALFCHHYVSILLSIHYQCAFINKKYTDIVYIKNPIQFPNSVKPVHTLQA